MTSPAYTASPGPVVCLHFLLDFPLATFVFESMYQRRQVGTRETEMVEVHGLDCKRHPE